MPNQHTNLTQRQPSHRLESWLPLSSAKNSSNRSISYRPCKPRHLRISLVLPSQERVPIPHQPVQGSPRRKHTWAIKKGDTDHFRVRRRVSTLRPNDRTRQADRPSWTNHDGGYSSPKAIRISETSNLASFLPVHNLRKMSCTDRIEHSRMGVGGSCGFHHVQYPAYVRTLSHGRSKAGVGRLWVVKRPVGEGPRSL